ncbi:guanine-N(7)-methyltransferase [Trichodelitschia bisporula]|uniref:mRNA cap guanine-N(7) methyltransferase n=1 Tax=Trichodelitschia bisporula TaxID=703511 RepID=A0A6G1HSP6_9PEZI|nr:guanine-N(7)-methyltransferase [Trichodelitschia bisporula]
MAPEKRARSPTPPPPSPPRKRKRPTGAARISASHVEEARRRAQEREQAIQQQTAAPTGVADFVAQHYNAVPQRGREWRHTESKIRGLRSYNNWVKSVLISKCSPRAAGAKVLDIGCGKGGDLQKWASRRIDLYVGLDSAEVSIKQAGERHREMLKSRKGFFHAEFLVRDCFGESLHDVPIIADVGFDRTLDARWGGGGFDVVSMMFCMHYAFESEEKARIMLKNVAGALKKGGRFLGVVPNSDVLTDKVKEHHGKQTKSEPAARTPEATSNPESPTAPPPDEPIKWGNSIYRVEFPGKTPADGIFRPPFGWKYFYFLEEAVEQVPEYVVPWEAFRALAEDYNLELEYRVPFTEVWTAEKDDPEYGPLSERMRVRNRNTGELQVSPEEMEAASFYHAFCFHKS